MTYHFFLLLGTGSVFVQGLLLYWIDRKRINQIEDSVSWWKWRKWTFKRLYRQIRGFLLIRVLSAHMFAAKTAFALAIVVATVWVTPDGQNAVLTGATVFYATALYLNDRFEYPAVYAKELNLVENKKERMMGDVFIHPTITNQGDMSAENLSVRLRVVDPSRGCSTFWFDAAQSLEREDEEVDAPLDVRRTREVQVGFDSAEEDISRLRMDDRLGEVPWAEIEIDSPDQLTSTWIYSRLGVGDFTDTEDFMTGMGYIQNS